MKNPRYIDSASDAQLAFANLHIPAHTAQQYSQEALYAMTSGSYRGPNGDPVDWHAAVNYAVKKSQTIEPGKYHGGLYRPGPHENYTIFANQDALTVASWMASRLHSPGAMYLNPLFDRPLVLVFGNGENPGAFLNGGRSQEDFICRSSALFACQRESTFYNINKRYPPGHFSDTAIYSPQVPFFRAPNGQTLDQPLQLDLLTCAAPNAAAIGHQLATALMQKRVYSMLYIAAAKGHENLVLGAWGCGHNGLHPKIVAHIFREALNGEFRGQFNVITFAISDWSPERRFLRPFAHVFGAI